MSKMYEMDLLKRFIKDITIEELHHLTDNIYNTLTDPKGRKLLKRYLFVKICDDSTFEFHSQCLNLYNMCLTIEKFFLSKEQRTLERELEIGTVSSNVYLLREIICILNVKKINFNYIENLDYILMNDLNDPDKETVMRYNKLQTTILCIKMDCKMFLQDKHDSFRNDIILIYKLTHEDENYIVKNEHNI